jgi:hypothetical protein
MNSFVIRSAGLDGWHYLGALRTELCSVSRPAKMPNKEHSKRNAERLRNLRTRILGSQFVTPKMIGVRTDLIFDEF